MSKYNIHPDFKKYENTKLPLNSSLLPLMNTFIETGFDKVKLAEGLQETNIIIPGYQNGNIEITIYEPEHMEKHAPCLIYFHGGGYVLKAAPYHKNLICQYALQTPCRVIYVDYRLAPRYPFPVGVEDCFAAYEWVLRNHEQLDIDQDRIAVGGDSAGGGLAAAVNLMARDRKVQHICFQMLIYPVTDARLISDSMKNYRDTPMWNAKLNEKMWKLYLKDGITEHREYASPIEAQSLKELPSTYLEVAEFDCLRDEGINFAEALKNSGIKVEFYETKGTMHGFEIAEKSEIVKHSMNKRIAALQEAFYEKLG